MPHENVTKCNEYSDMNEAIPQLSCLIGENL